MVEILRPQKSRAQDDNALIVKTAAEWERPASEGGPYKDNQRTHTQYRRVGHPRSEHRSGVCLEEAAEEAGGVFAEGAIVGAEGGEEMRVDVEFADDFVVNEDGDDDFGFGFEGAGQIARIGVNVIDDDGLAGGRGSAADALVERNAGVGRLGALEMTENENVVVAFLFEHVKANPVVTSDFFVEESDDALHKGIS